MSVTLTDREWNEIDENVKKRKRIDVCMVICNDKDNILEQNSSCHYLERRQAY